MSAPLRFVTALLAAALASACARDPFAAAQRTINDGSAMKWLQGSLSGFRQCADLLAGLVPPPNPDGSPSDLVSVDPLTPQVRALRAAGLIEAEAVSSRGSVVYRPTAAARPFVEETGPEAEIRHRRLCYARRQVMRVWIAPHGRTDSLPFLAYSFRLVDAPAWARRPDMQAAFPWLRDAYTLEHKASDNIVFNDATRRWNVSLRLPDLMDSRIPFEVFSGHAPQIRRTSEGSAGP